MGITDSEAWKKWQEINKAAEDTPSLYLLADALGFTGEDGVITEAIPEMWKSYDKRSDQIFIQEPDKKLEKALFSWVKVKKLMKSILC